jgi:hypothetical protein
MGARTYYTLRQARWLLRGGEGKMVDGKTLKTWLAEAGIVPQPNPRDRRERRITRTQLEELARKHRIVLPSDETLDADIEQIHDLSILVRRVEALGQMMESMQDTLTAMQQMVLTRSQGPHDAATQQVVSEMAEAFGKQIRSLLDEVRKEYRDAFKEQLEAVRRERTS